MRAYPFFRPLTCRVSLRPLVFLGRMLWLQPLHALLMTAVVGTRGVVHGVGLTLLLPLLSLIGVDTGARMGGPAHMLERAFAALGIPLQLGPILALFLAIGVIQTGLYAAQQYLIVACGEEMTAFVRRRLFDGASRAAWSVLAAGRGGHLVNAVVSEASRIGVVYGNGMTVFGLALDFLVYVALAAWVSWRFTLLAAVVGIVSMAGLQGLYRASRRLGAYTTAASNRMQEVLNEHIGAAKLIRSLGAGTWSRATFGAAAADVRRSTRRHYGSNVLVRMVVEPIGLVVLVAMIYLSIAVVRLPAAELMLLLLIFYRAHPRLVVLEEMLQRVAGVLPAYEAVAEAIKHLDDSREREGGVPFTGLRDAIELKGVTVRRGDRTVLKGVDLTIRGGSMVALVGRSGGGKTTLLDVLAGVVPPEAGVVCVDGIPLSELDLTTFRQRLGVVPQENVFFHDTIRANLRIVAPDASDAEMWAALAAAHADDFVRGSGQALETLIGDQGLRLSVGQRQRLSLARALLRRPEILLLDEPSSALDAETEAAIRETFRRLRGRVTVVLVSHRPALAQDADAIYTVAHGRLEPVKAGVQNVV